MTETRTISIPVYRDAEGNPVCYSARNIGHVCELLRFGDRGPMCAKTNAALCRDFYGHIRPSANCPLWKDDEK